MVMNLVVMATTGFFLFFYGRVIRVCSGHRRLLVGFFIFILFVLFLLFLGIFLNVFVFGLVVMFCF